MGFAYKVFYLIVVFLIMRIIHSMGIPLSDRKVKINYYNDRESAVIRSVDPQTYYDNPDFITIEQRIKRCKESHPEYDYKSLSEDEKEELIDNSNINPCRVDCVIHKKDSSTNIVQKSAYTVFFTDGKTKCGSKKVCKLKNNVGVCILDNRLLKANRY